MAVFTLDIVTPKERFFHSEKVERVILRTTEGDMAILAKHAPLVAEVAIGEMRIKKEGEEYVSYFLSGGFIEVSREKTTILADSAVLASEIQLEEERRAAQLAEEKLKRISEDREMALTQRALQEALTKIKIAEKR